MSKQGNSGQSGIGGQSGGNGNSASQSPAPVRAPRENTTTYEEKGLKDSGIVKR